MSIKIFIPRDAAAIAVGAEEVVAAIATAAKQAGASVQIVRNSSRGMLWLEPLVEVEANGKRYGFGPVAPGDITALVALGLFDAGKIATLKHALAIGEVEKHAWLAQQTRLTFARAGRTDPLSLDDYRGSGGTKGLAKALVARPCRNACRGDGLGPARPRWRGFPDRDQMEDRRRHDGAA